MNYKWINIENLKKDIKSEPEKYTPRFKLIMERWE
jgi:isopentenyldiphosphate isomerase